MELIKCPYCKGTIEMDEDWAKKNGRIFCPTCCKSFEVHIEEKEEKEEFDDGWPF